MPSFRMVMEAVVDAFERKREEIRERAAGTRGAPGRDRPDRAQARATRGGRSWRRRSRSCCGGRRPRARRLRRRPQVPARLGPGAAAGPRRARGRRAHARRDGRRRHLRPARRRLRPLLGRRRLARPPLREDALRQRPAGPRLPARLAGARPRALPPRLRRDAGLDAARDARPRGRLLLRPRRRLRGRGGPLLRLDARREIRDGSLGRRPGRAGDLQFYGVSEARQLRGREHPPSGRWRRRRRQPEGLAEARPAPSTRRAPSGSGRGSTTSA